VVTIHPIGMAWGKADQVVGVGIMYPSGVGTCSMEEGVCCGSRMPCNGRVGLREPAGGVVAVVRVW